MRAVPQVEEKEQNPRRGSGQVEVEELRLRVAGRAERAHCAGALNGAGLCAGGLARISLLSHELQKNARIWGICHQGAGCAGCKVTGAFPGLPQSLGTRVTLILPVYIVNASQRGLRRAVVNMHRNAGIPKQLRPRLVFHL